jgi:CRP/FNR family transcriptional regulator, cyclic AMP receptor protein
VFGIYGVGDLVEEKFLGDYPRSVGVISVERSPCSVISRETIKQFVAKEPEFAFDLIRLVIAKARRATLAAKSLVFTNAYGRLAGLLFEIAIRRTVGVRKDPYKISHTENARCIGRPRERVNHVLGDLEKGNCIVFDSIKRINILSALPSHW